MNKNLEALNKLKNISCYMGGEYIGESFEVYEDELNIIETTLKEKEQDQKKLKALEFLKHFINSLGLKFMISPNDLKILVVDSCEFEVWYTCKTLEEHDLLYDLLKEELL